MSVNPGHYLVSTQQNDNSVGGDLVGGHKIVNVTTYSPKTPISELNERFKAELGNPEGLSQFVGDLQHYWEKATGSDVRGLQAKLTESGRADLIHFGETAKEMIAKKILKFQTYRSAQDIFVWVFAEVFARFMLEVWPKVQEGADRSCIDSLINEKVMDPVLNGLEENVLALHRHELIGLLFYLGGNCHIRWDKC